MKPIRSLFCALMLGTTALATMPAASWAAGVRQDGTLLSVGAGAGILIGQQDDDRDRRHRHDNDGRRDDRDHRDNGGNDRRGGGEQRDDGIGRAMDIGRSRGTVMNAWPQGGSLFLVRVNTSHGRVDLLIDVDSGRIVGER
jgi:hypothetical protein